MCVGVHLAFDIVLIGETRWHILQQPVYPSGISTVSNLIHHALLQDYPPASNLFMNPLGTRSNLHFARKVRWHPCKIHIESQLIYQLIKLWTNSTSIDIAKKVPKKVPMNSVSDCQNGSMPMLWVPLWEVAWHWPQSLWKDLKSHWTSWYAKKREKVLNFTRKMMAA